MFLGTKLILGNTRLYEEFGILNVSTGNKTSPFGFTQTVIEDKPTYATKPIFNGVDREALSFTLRFARDKEWDDDMRLKFARLIFKEEYQQLISEDYPHIKYNVICTDQPNKTLYNHFRGYIDVTFRCDSPYAWSNEAVETYKIAANEEKIIYIENKSNVVQYVYPDIEIISSAANNTVEITNMTDNNKGFIISKLEDKEKVYIDGENSFLFTTIPNVYRYNDFTGNWLRLKMGTNKIKIKGECQVTFKNNYPLAL